MFAMKTLNEIIGWLSRVEASAQRLYADAARVFHDDLDLSELLRQLSIDEGLHHELLVTAGESIRGQQDGSFISIDPETRRKVEKPFNELSEKLAGRGLSKDELIDHIISIEFSELNSLLFYVMDELKESSPRQFSSAAHDIEGHDKRIKAFLVQRPEYEELWKRAIQFPKILKDRILIVEDREMNLKLLKSVLEGEGTLEAAMNGDEALRTLGSGTFSAIIADIDMPMMDGVELYRRAVERFPRLKPRFVFFTSTTDPERLRLLRENNLKVIQKPASISEIRRAVREIIESKTT